MIGRRDDRRKEEAVKKAELELKKKKEEAVREVYVAVSRHHRQDC
jgi:U3 small nucleolar RNA-associated protein 24